MSGMSLFLVGLVALGNIGLLGFLILDRNRQIKKSPTEVDETEEPSDETTDSQEVEQVSLNPVAIGKSSFDIDEMEKMFEEVMERKLPVMLKVVLGEVNIHDTEFNDSKEEPNDTNPAHESAKFKAMSSEESEKAFAEDIRNMESQEVSAPNATGSSIDEIEKAVDVAVNPYSSDESKAAAGDIIRENQDTYLMEALSEKERFKKGLDEAIRLSIEKEMSEKSGYRPKPRRETEYSYREVFNPMDLIAD